MGWMTRLLPSLRRRAALRALGAEFVREGRDAFVLVEGDKRLPIHAELQGQGEIDFVVRESDAVGGWLPPHGAEALTEARRREVLDLFLRYLDIFDYRVAVERAEPDRPH